MLRTINLASGSKGNSTVIESDTTLLLLDDGLSVKTLEARLQNAGVDINKLTAILVSHTHNDHISGIEKLVKKYKVPVYASVLQWSDGKIKIPDAFRKSYSGNNLVIGDINITLKEVSHDASQTFAFTFDNGIKKIGYATDLGYVDAELLNILSDCNMIYIESNHDMEMLMFGDYPAKLKNRINSDRGHLSNIQCGEVVIELVKRGVKHFSLAHLSEKNNCIERAFGYVYYKLEQVFGKDHNVVVTLCYQKKIGTNYLLRDGN